MQKGEKGWQKHRKEWCKNYENNTLLYDKSHTKFALDVEEVNKYCK